MLPQVSASLEYAPHLKSKKSRSAYSRKYGKACVPGFLGTPAGITTAAQPSKALWRSSGP